MATLERILYIGPAGSGKTSTLRERYVSLVAEHGAERVLFLVANRAAARAAQEAATRATGRSLGGMRIATRHGYALGLVTERHHALGYTDRPTILTGPEQFDLVREMLAEPDEHARWGDFAHVLSLHGFAAELREFVLRAQDRLLLPEDAEKEAQSTGRPELVEACRFFRRYLNMLDARAAVDHANAVALAVKALQEDPAMERPAAILVDDFQDLTIAEEHLIAALAGPATTVLAAGDRDAHVFGFRGTSLEPLRRFEARFAPARTQTLGASRRALRPSAAWQFDHLAEEAAAVARECRRIAVADGVPLGDIAIVVRRHGAGSRAIRRALDRDAVPYVVVGEDRPLGAESVLRPVVDLVLAALRPDEREDLLPGLLSSPVCGLDAYEVRGLRRESRLRRLTLAALVADPPDDLPGTLAAALRRLRDLLEEVARRDASERPDDVFWFLWESLDYFAGIVADGEQADLDAIEAFGRQVARFSDRRPGARLSDYIQALEGAAFGPERWSLPLDRRPNAVRILTAHNAVGLEYDSVIVAGCVEGEFPDLHDSRAMVDVRDLGGAPDPVARAKARLEEERRLFGVAASRARRRLVLTAARETSQGLPLAPSRFAERLGVEWERGAGDAPGLTRDAIEASLRRTLADRRADPVDRRAAVRALGRLPGVEPDRWWYEKDWTDPGAPLVADPFLTSYSRLSAYDNCPLQYLYQRELGLDPDKSHNMTLGSWVHDVIDECAKGEVEATEDALVAALRARWDPEVFPSVAVEAQYRRDAEEMLRRWLATDGREKPLASEVDFTYEIEGATMRGKIDRVVRLGGRSVRLIDYKTSRNAKSQEEVDDDLQLASYHLALKRDPKLASLGEPRYLELAFLGDFWRDGFARRGIDVAKRPDYEREAVERLEGFVRGIKAEQFRPEPSADCRWCAFKTLCPVWPEGDEVTL